jgi:AraC-like DNA-binding protein
VRQNQQPASRVDLPCVDGPLALEHVLASAVDATLEPWSMARLASVCGLSQRSLHRVTVRVFGVAPIALLRRQRLARARADLQALAFETTVTNVALRWGFSHLGRFARDYARQFGESPSETIKRARNGSWGEAAATGAKRPTRARGVTLEGAPDCTAASPHRRLDDGRHSRPISPRPRPSPPSLPSTS